MSRKQLEPVPFAQRSGAATGEVRPQIAARIILFRRHLRFRLEEAER